MKLPENYKKFPRNALPPRNVIIHCSDYNRFIVHGYRFRGIQDFYQFLKKDPDINFSIFSGEEISSLNSSRDFAGKPYRDALEDLVKTKDPGYQEYLKIQSQMKARKGTSHEYETVSTVAGGFIHPVRYATGSPKVFQTERLISKPKFITVDMQIAYNWRTTKEQVFHRAVIITNIIRALERKGYNISVNSFMVSQKYDEVISSVFEVKQQGGNLNYQTLYKSLVDVEFFRRLCFRLIEISSVVHDWNDGYGHTSEEDFVRKLLKLKKNDIYFDQPSNMGIYGTDIGADFERAIHTLDLDHVIDVKKEAKVLEKSIEAIKK